LHEKCKIIAEVRGLEIPDIGDCFFNKHNESYVEIKFSSFKPYEVEKALNYLSSILSKEAAEKLKKKNKWKKRRINDDQAKISIKILESNFNKQKQKFEKVVSLTLTSKGDPGKALNELKKINGYVGFEIVKCEKINKIIVTFSEFPNEIVDLFYNPNDKQRRNDVFYHGSFLSFSFPKIVCNGCKAHGHWKESCSERMKEMVKEHGPFLHCKNILLKKPKREYQRKRFKPPSNGVITVSEKTEMTRHHIFVTTKEEDLKIMKEKKGNEMKKGEKKKIVDLKFSEKDENQKKFEISEQIKTIQNHFISKEFNFEKFKFSETKIDEEKIENDISFLNSKLDEGILDKSLNYNAHFKKTIFYNQIKKEFGKKNRKAELIFKIFLFTILQEKKIEFKFSKKEFQK